MSTIQQWEFMWTENLIMCQLSLARDQKQKDISNFNGNVVCCKLAAMCNCEDCLGRTPYASLIATTIMCLGVGLFCGTGFRALDLTLNGIFGGLFKFHVSWYIVLCVSVDF